ncbi:MAG: hypothetical protein E7050_11250 [Lentisphaerae bacterium]|nr:hypothetical protein [Lentisphaerota bacterium]
MKKLFSTVVIIFATLVHANEIFSFQGGDFENNSLKKWRFVDNDSPHKATLTAGSNAAAGNSAAQITVNAPMKTYFAMIKGAAIQKTAPRQLSLYFKGNASATAVLRWNIPGKVAYESFKLPKSTEWKKYDFLLNPPANVTGLTLELRGKEAGTYSFDEVKFFIEPEKELLQSANIFPFTDGSFELPLGKKWHFISNGENQKASISQEKNEAFDGNHYIQIKITGNFKTYCALQSSTQIRSSAPEEFSIAYKGNSQASVTIRWNYLKNNKNQIKYENFNLPPSTEWKQHNFLLNPPANSTGLTIELRGKKVGDLNFDALTFYSKSQRNLSILLLQPMIKSGDPVIKAPMMLPGPEVQAVLDKYGFTVACAKYSEKMDSDFLKKFNVVVLGLTEESGQPMSPEARKKMNSLLWDFTRNGGGLVIFRAPGWDFDRGIDLLNQFLQPAGAEILCEQIIDKEFYMAPSMAKMFWSGNIAPHEVTTGVKGIFFCDIVGNWGAYSDFTNAIKVTDPAWQILIKGQKSASTFFRKKGHPIRPANPGTYSSEPPMLAVRDFGKGRIVLFPAASTIYWQDGGHFYWGRGEVMNGTYQGKTGNNLKLVENIFLYASAPSKGKFGGWKPAVATSAKEMGFSSIDWTKSYHTGDFSKRCYRGLIGAQSNLSVGTGSPEEFIAAAQKAGYDFIAFLEPLEKMNADKFDRLKKICQAASDEKFFAYPGLLYKDNSGNQWAAFSDTMFWPKSEWMSSEHPDRLSTLNASTRGWGWPPVIMVAPGKNPEKPYLQANYKIFAVQTWHNGKLVEDSRDILFRLNHDKIGVYPLTIHLVDSPKYIPTETQKGMHSFIWWPDNNVVTGYSGNYCVYKNSVFWARPLFVSEGPVIRDFKIYNFGTSDLAIRGNDRWRMHVRVSSDAGIKEIKILTADGKIFRRFLANGKKIFDTQVDNWHSANRNFFLEVTDVNSKKALSAPVGTSVQENTFQRCSDNINSMPRGKWFAQPKYMQNPRGFENYLASRSWEYYLPYFDGIGKEGIHKAVNLHPQFNSRFGTILDCRIDHYYPDAKKYNADASDNASCAIPNQFYKAVFRQTMFTCRNNGSLITRVDGEVEVLQDFRSDWFAVLNVSRRSDDAGTVRTFIHTNTDGKINKIDLKNQKSNIRQTLPKNGFAAMYPGVFNGSVGFIAISDNLEFELRPNGSDRHHRIYAKVKHAPEYRKGEKIKVSFIAVVSRLDPPNDETFITSIIDDFGLAGTSPKIKVSVKNGQMIENGMYLKLAADDYAFNGQISQAALPLDMPVMIQGLNPNWDAGILYKGKTRLLIPEYRTNNYDQRFIEQVTRDVENELLRIPVQPDGTGIAQIDTNLAVQNVFIGNLLTCDVPELKLTLLDYNEQQLVFEAHNQTDKNISATVCPGKGFVSAIPFRKKVTVPPGTSLSFKINK